MFKKPKNKSTSLKWHNRRKTLVTLRWKRGIPRLVIHEKYEKIVKWSLRVFAVVGIISSILYIPTWYLSLLLAIVLFAAEQFLERAVFLYTIFYWQPLPEFNWNIGEEWVAMGFAFPVSKNESELNVVGPVFKSESYAHEFFEVLRKWNYGNQQDKHNNVCLSLITVDDGYYAFIYPNLERPSIKETFSDIENKNKLKKYGKEPQKFVVQYMFCKHFIYGTNSVFEKFSQEQSEGKPYWLQPFIQKPGGSSSILFSEQPILKFHIKNKQRSGLKRQEVEYQHFKNVIDVKPEK
jgi:hypothetical protein